MAATKIEASNIASGAVPSTGFTSRQIFTSAGTWTRPTDITKVIVEVQGGGGGGALHDGSVNRNGGGSGGYAKKFIDVTSITTSTIVVGAAGVGGTSSGVVPAGGGGGTSSFTCTGHTLSCTGGDAGATTSIVTDGGIATGGDINISGGGARIVNSSMGNNSILGIAGINDTTSTQAQRDAKGYGSGGGFSGASAQPAGDGGAGVVIVWEYK